MEKWNKNVRVSNLLFKMKETNKHIYYPLTHPYKSLQTKNKYHVPHTPHAPSFPLPPYTHCPDVDISYTVTNKEQINTVDIDRHSASRRPPPKSLPNFPLPIPHKSPFPWSPRYEMLIATFTHVLHEYFHLYFRRWMEEFFTHNIS